ncbi:hypothetical protein BS78_02G038000 [Paspalum vaginatum]|nr:hypothetical protein BS78_02G038000 [Paspalum vaginatum]
MDVVTAYLYGSLDSEIYIKVPDGINVPNHMANRNMYCYNCLSEFLSLKGYTKNDDCPCVFIKKTSSGFCIISVYVADLNIIGNETDINEARHHLKTEFEMKDLVYIQKVLEKFNMDKSYPAKTPMVVRSIDMNKDPFLQMEEGEEILAQIYLANSTRPDIAFTVNLFARYSASSTKHHWNEVKNVFRYLNGTRDLGLFYGRNQEQTLVGYTYAGYLSDPCNARSQTSFVYLQGGAAISWKSSKQTLVATSTNHSEIIALYEASKECVWLRRTINHMLQSCGLGSIESPTIIYEDNAACVVQMKTGKEINIMQTKSCDNLVDLFTKSLPYSSFSKCVKGIDVRRFRDLQESGGVNLTEI